MTIEERQKQLKRQIAALVAAEAQKARVDDAVKNLDRARLHAERAYREYRKTRNAFPAEMTISDLALELTTLNALLRGEGGSCVFEQTRGEIWIVVGVRGEDEVELTTLRRPRIRRTVAAVTSGKSESGYRFTGISAAVNHYLSENWSCKPL